MAKTFIALLYSIGIAGGGRLVMADWRAMMEGIGLRNPRTLIATGNAVFESDGRDIRKLEKRLEDAFELGFGRRVDVVGGAASSFRRMAAGNPFPKESRRDGSRVAVRVMREPAGEGLGTTLKPRLTQGERVKVVRGVLWIHFKHEPARSRLMPVLASKRLGAGTVRNWNTIRRLCEMAERFSS